MKWQKSWNDSFSASLWDAVRLREARSQVWMTARFIVVYRLTVWKFTSRLTDSIIILDFLLHIWRVLLKLSSGTICLHTLLWLASRCRPVAALQRWPDAVRLIWITQECSPQKTEAVRQQPTPPSLFSIIITGGDSSSKYTGVFTWIICAGKKPVSTSGGERCLQVPLDPHTAVFPPSTHVYMHTNPQDYTALLTAFFPGEVITLWGIVRHYAQASLSLLRASQTHFSHGQLISVCPHRKQTSSA